MTSSSRATGRGDWHMISTSGTLRVLRQPASRCCVFEAGASYDGPTLHEGAIYRTGHFASQEDRRASLCAAPLRPESALLPLSA
eukprot:scaffold3951_cov258-Pinguiococcus_pyrenoidosus.AAC.6